MRSEAARIVAWVTPEIKGKIEHAASRIIDRPVHDWRELSNILLEPRISDSGYNSLR